MRMAAKPFTEQFSTGRPFPGFRAAVLRSINTHVRGGRASALGLGHGNLTVYKYGDIAFRPLRIAAYWVVLEVELSTSVGVEGGCGMLVGSGGFGELGQAIVVVVGMFDSGRGRSFGVVLGRYHATVLCRIHKLPGFISGSA